MAPDIRSAVTPYPRPMRLLHWLTAFLVIATAIVILLRDEVVSGRGLRGWLLEGHRHLGLLVLICFALRVLLRLRTRDLPHHPMPLPMRLAAGATHLVLYGLLLAMPLLGWALSSAADQTIHFFGLTVPHLVAADDDLADRLQVWHIDAAWALLVVVCMHIGAALYHHLVLRDGVLRRMWPR